MTDNTLKPMNSPPPPPRTVSGTVVHQIPGKGENNENVFMNLIRRHDILMELKNLNNLKCKNIYILQSNDIYKWLGVIFVREGYYKGGIFKFNVIFSEERTRNPVIQFITHIYHPLVNKYGYFNPIYNENIDIKHSVSKLLFVLNDTLSNEKTFYEFKEEKISNKHSWDSFRNNLDFFKHIVSDCVKNSISNDILYENFETESIKFQKIDNEQFIRNKNKILDIYRDMTYLDEKSNIDSIVFRFKRAIESKN
jgi:ubiquitin-protein ligase